MNYVASIKTVFEGSEIPDRVCFEKQEPVVTSLKKVLQQETSPDP